MSKSYDNAIPIFADDDELRLKVGRIRTSPLPLGSPIDPESDIVFAIYSLVASPDEQADMRTRYEAGSVGYRQAKAELTGEAEGVLPAVQGEAARARAGPRLGRRHSK